MPAPQRLALVVGTLLAVGLSLPAGAELTVIADLPGSRPISDFTATVQARQTETAAAAARKASRTLDVDAILPVTTPTMSPGPVSARPLALPLTRPLFLIGSDATSRAWLVRNRQRLKQRQAVGLLIEAHTRADLEAIAALAAGLPITPASASDLARELGLQHYPLLITPHGIEP